MGTDNDPGTQSGQPAALNLSISISPDVISQEIQLGETLLLDVKTLAYFGLDELGTRFWAAMQQSADADDVMEIVASQTGQSTEHLAARFKAILKGMHQSRLIELKRSQ